MAYADDSEDDLQHRQSIAPANTVLHGRSLRAVNRVRLPAGRGRWWVLSREQDGAVSQVLCDGMELDEYREVIAVGDHLWRRAGRYGSALQGSSLEEIEWHLDQYAWTSGEQYACISGTVTAIEAVYFRLTRQPDQTWGPAPGTPSREPISTTAATRMPREEPGWPTPPARDADDPYQPGHRLTCENDEQLYGWLLTLDNDHTDVVENSFRLE